MPRPPTTANELRRAFTGFFAERGHTRGARRPASSRTTRRCCSRSPAWCRSSRTSRRRGAAVPAGHRRRRSAPGPAASTTTSTTSAAPTATSSSSRCSATSASATTSRPTPSRGRGSCVTEVLGVRRRPPLDHGPRERRRGRADLARRGRRADGAHPAPRRQGQLLADGRDRPVRSVLGAAHRPRPGTSVPTAARWTTRTASGSWSSGTSSSCSTTRRPTARARRCRGRRSTPAPASSASWPAPGRRRRVGDRPAGAARSTRRSSLTGQRLRPVDYAHRLQPARPRRARPLGRDARERRRLPVERGPRLRAAPHPAPGRAPRLPARRRQARDCPRSSRPPSTSWATPTPTWSRTGTSSRRHHRGGGALPPDAAHRPGHPRRRAGSAARRRCRARGVQAARHLRLPARADRPRSPPSAASASTSTASTPRWPSSAGGPRRPARPAAPTTSASTPTARSSSSSAPPSSSATREAEGDGRACSPCARRRTARSRCSSTARRSTPSRGGQVGDTGTITTATGRGRGARHHLRPAGAAPPHRPDRRGRDHRRPGGPRRHRRRAARRHPPQPHRHPPAALGAARGARRARQAGRLAGRARPPALRLQPLRGRHARGDRAHRGRWPTARCWPTTACAPTRRPRPRRRRWARSPSSATSTATSCGCSRPGATASSCAAARTSGRPATSARSRSCQRGLDRLEPAPHRGRHRHGQRGPAAARRARLSARRPASLGTTPDAVVEGVRRSARRDQGAAGRDEGAAGQRAAAAGPASWRPAAVDGVVVARVDGFAPDDLRDLALACASSRACSIVVLGGETDTGGDVAGRRGGARSGHRGRRPDQGRGARPSRAAAAARATSPSAGGKDPSRHRRGAAPSPARRPASAPRRRAPRAACGPSASTSGRKRIGVAVSDRSGTIATRSPSCARSAGAADDQRRIARAGGRGGGRAGRRRPAPLARRPRRARPPRVPSPRPSELATVVGVPVETFDERLTTVTADRALMELRMRAAGAPPGRRQGRRRRDAPGVARPPRQAEQARVSRQRPGDDVSAR